MKEQEEGGLIRGFRAALAAILTLALSLPVGGLSFQSAYADEETQQGDGSDAAGQTLSADAEDVRIAVLSDTHYYPLNYVSDCEDYRTYVGGDPKMLEESGSILDAALAMVREDRPDILLVSGDLTKDGEKLGHQQLAERFQQIEDSSDTEVFVINGNHDIYNYQDSCTFENGQRESAETTTPDEFKQIYANFGYNGEFEAQYFANPNAASGEQAGGLSYTVDLGKFTIVAVDSGMYSPDAGTGYDTNEHVTAGRVDEDLMPWVVEQTKNAEAEGDTVIGLMHHGLVPHFTGEENILSEYVVENWRDVASQFADAGMRYIFTGHMHANDMAQFTSNAGNAITDLETGSLSSWMSPVRTVTLTKGAALDDGTQRTHETFSVSSESVKAISFKDHTGAVTQIDDLKSYTQQKLYPETLFNNMANGMLRPMLQEIGEAGLRPWLAKNLPDVDIDTMVLSAVRDALAGGMEIELGTGIGRVHVEYRNGGIQLSPSGTAGIIGNTTITDAQILRLVDDVLNTVETKYIDDPEWLLGKVDEIVTQVSNMGITSLDSEQHTIYDLVFVVLTGHYAGQENPPAWVEDALAYIESGNVVQTLIATLIDDVMPIIDTLLADNSIDTGIAFSGLWKTAIDSQTDNGNLKSTLELFGFNSAAIRSMIEGLINEYMSPSFLTGMGSLISEIAGSMLYDSNFADDVIDGDGVTIEFDGTTTAPEPSVDNGLLPTQVTMTLGANPATDRNFRWYTDTNVTSGTVQVATDDQFQDIVAEAQASSEQVTKPKTQLNLGLVTTYGTQQAQKHSASVSGLDDGATYYYRVGDKDNGWWSGAYQFATGDAADADDAFTFINVNDSQGMVESDYDVYKNTLAQADAAFPGASFTVHGGDFVDDGANEDYWTWALDDEAGVAQGMSMTPAAGNHEAKSDVEGITDANPIVSHFDLANVPEGQDLSTGVYYSYVYKNATFVVLNTNDLAADESLSQAQYDWAYDVLANAGTQWKIVLMHKSPYSNGPHQADSDVTAIRSQINTLAAACDVDLVLSGHDHVYNRTPFLSRGAEQDVTLETQTYEGANYETALNPNGTAFVIAGTAGVKNYVQTPSADIPSEVALDLSVPVYSGITIDGDHLYYQAYRVDGGSSTLVDSFAISKAEEDVPAWKQVEDMIASLPDAEDVTVDDEAAITAARDAYDALSAEDQAQVSNLDHLEAAEKMLNVLKGTAGKQTVHVNNKSDFVNALNNPNVGTIITDGAEIEFEDFWGNEREYVVNRDLVIGGSSTLRYVEFHVQNGATLLLRDSLYIDDTRTQGSTYGALNPVEVYANSALVTTDSVSLRTEYGRGDATEGVCIKLMEEGASAVLGSNGLYWAAEGAVYSPASNTSIVINDGTYNAKNETRFIIDSYGDVTVNGGTISSLWTQGSLRITGGTFEHQDSASSEKVPLKFDGQDAHITGGTFVAYNGQTMEIGDGSNVHILADNNGNVNIGGVTPYVGSVSTQNYKDVSIGYVASNGWGASDGIYRVDGAVGAASVEDIASLPAAQMSNRHYSQDGDYMQGELPGGTSTVFGKYWIYGNGKSAPTGSGITGGGQAIVYGPTRTIQNNPVEGVTIDGDAMRVVDLSQDGADTLRLNGYTTPANAFDNGISWASDNEQIATVSANAGQGIVSVHQAGGANITATSDSNSSLSATVEVIAVDPTINGLELLDEDTASATYEANKGFSSDTYDERVSFKYSVDDNTVATIDADTGVLTKLAAGVVKVAATLYVDGAPTDVTVERDVVCKMRPEVTVDDVNALLDVQVSDANEAMASEHVAQTFNTLIANSEGQNDAYAIGEVYSEDAPAEGLIESAAQFFGLAKAEKTWKVDVTIQAAPYVAAFDEALGFAAGAHQVSGDTSNTVTLVWRDSDPSAEVPVSAGWALENEDASPVQFQAKCTSYQVDFKYVGEDWASIAAPEPVNVLAGAEIGDKLPTPEREGFTFVGWYKDWDETDGFKDENLVTSTSVIGEDTTLYGRWAVGTQAMSAYVVFDPNGGTFTEDDETPKVVQVELTSGADHVDTEEVPEDPSLANHVFAGWYYKAVSEGAPDGVELPFNASATEIVGNLHVYAKWKEKPQVEIAAGDNDFTYNGEAQMFQFSVESDGVDANSFTVEYRPADSEDEGNWSSQTVPTDAGEYDVRITRGEDATYASFEQMIESAVKIGKASQAAPELAVQGGAESATIKVSGGDANGFEWDDNERFESAADVSDGAVTAAGPGTYFVRAKEDNNHAAGAIAQVNVVKVDFSAGEGSLPETTHNAWLIGAGQAVGEDGMPADPTREGYEFTGWKMGEANFDAGTVVDQSVSVDAAWTAKTFTVNFDADGGAFEGNEGDPITVTYDQNWPELPTPAKAGMNFNGWWLGEGEDAVRIISGTPVKITGNATLKAQWTDKVAVVVTVGQENEFVYDGVEHSFSYSTDPEGVEMTVEYRSAASESDGDWSPALPVDAGAYDVRLTHVEDETYAEFSAAIGHALVIDKADQELPERFFSASTFGDYVLVTFSSAEMVGNLEWANNEDFVDATEVTQGDTFEVRSEGAYYLRFKGDANHNPSPSASFTVVKATFDVGEGVLSQGDKAAWLIQSGTTLGGNLPEASREGYKFDGWFAGETQIGAETQINDSIAAAAKWTANTYQLAFDADGDGQADDGIAPMTVTYDSAYGELPVPVAQAGKIFEGWLLDGMVVSAEDTVKITENTLLTAKWTDKREIAVLPDADVNKAYVYGDEGIVFKFDATEGTMPERFEILYGDAEQNTWDEAAPVNAGTYDVKVTYAEDEAFKAFERVFDDALVIAKADQTMPDLSVTAGSEGATVSFEPAEGASYERADNAEFDDAQPVEGGTFQVTESGTYYVRAKGDANHNASAAQNVQIVKVAFDADGGAMAEDSVDQWLMPVGGTVGGNMPADPTREGYEFAGWTAGGEPFVATTEVGVDTKVVAGWTANSYTVTLDADSGTLPDGAQSTITVTYDQPWPELPEPTMAGKFFQGWFLDDTEVSAGATVKIIGDTTLTAHWGDKQVITVTPAQDANSFTYDGEPHAFAYAVDPEGVIGITVEYAAAGTDDWSETAPTNAGAYDVRVTRDEDGTYAAYVQTFEGGLVIAKADGAAAPELGVTADAEGAMIAFEPAEGVGYEYADNADFADAKDVDDGGFQATEPGTWYVRAKGDANHEPGEAASVQIAKVTFDAASGTVEGSVAWFLESGESVGEGNLPTATREGFEFAGWTVDGEPFDGTTPVIGDIIAVAGWTEVGDEPGPDEPQAPAAPVADEVATLEGVAVTLNGVNEINSDEGNKTHPDVTFASAGEDVQPLIAKSFTIGQPVETDGGWTVEVTMDAQKYLDAYAAMGDPAYGAHYFANTDEDGVETFALTYDADARAWVLADAQQAAFAYDITCLTLRPAEAEIYTGGTSENGGHFIDQYVVDGRGNVVSIDELNERLDEGVTASIKYYDADGNEVTDDTVAGHYIARIDVSAAEEQARAAAIDDTVEVNVGGREYTFNLEPSELVIRSVSDAAEAERGDLNVALVDGSDAQAVATALGQAQGGVVAALPGETTILFNGNPEVEIADRSDITLLSDDLLPGGREDALLARVQEVLGAEALADNTDFQYLDLVDRSQSNAWVSSTAGTQVFWRIPEGADTGSIKILHFVDLHRDYTMADEDVVDLIAGCDVEAMSLTFDEENGFVSFAVPEGGFSPFLMTWNDAVDDPDDPDQPGTDPDQPGTDPDQPAQKVTVTFDANGGQLSTGTPGSVEIAAGGTIAMLPQPVRTGYAFVGWTAADGTAFDITTPVNESMTVIAQWTPNVYQISLDAQGGALAADEASIEATFDAPIGQLPVPTREGYEFLGWFTQPQGGDEVAAETMYRTAGPSTYYAQWDVLPATRVVLTLDANGGMFQGGQETIAEAVAINAPLHGSDLTVPQREGFELAGWYLDESLTQPVVLVEDADPDAGIVATTFAQDATLYAKWLEDLSSDADISFGGILQAYTGSAMPAVPAFGESFPNDERAKVQVLYRASLMRADEWTDQAPVNVGAYDVRFVYEGSGEYAAFVKDYPAGITITKATLAQVGLTVDTPEVEAGTKLADVSLEGATVTSQVTGAVIEGIWAWLDADGVVDETGAYQAVFVPADAENFEPLHVEIQLTVKEAGADEPGGSDKPTEPTDPGLPGTDPTDPDNQPGAGTGTDTGSGSGAGEGTGAGTGSGSDGADGRNQMKLVATGDPVAGMIVGFGAVLVAALITGLVALRNTRRKN